MEKSIFRSDFYPEVWENCAELLSEFETFSDLKQIAEDLKQSIVLFSYHFRYRLPWMCAKPLRSGTTERLFAQHRPENDNIFRPDDIEIIDFMKKVSKNKLSIIKNIAMSITTNKATQTVIHGIECSNESFIASMIIPSLFGFFIGQKNIRDFIESIGIAFDYFASIPGFLENFPNSFLCRVLREFFFAPFIREFVGEQDTIFTNFFLYNKVHGYSKNYTKYQRFTDLFFTELKRSLSVADSFIKELFQRITRKYDAFQLIVVVITNSIILPLISFPTVFGVLRQNICYKNETVNSLNLLRYYLYSICEIPFNEGFDGITEIKDHEKVDKKLIEEVAEKIMEPTKQISFCVDGFDEIYINFASVKKLAKILGATFTGNYDSYKDDRIFCFSFGIKQDDHIFIDNKKYNVAVKLFNKIHPTQTNIFTPTMRASIELIKDVDLKEFNTSVEGEINKYRSMSIEKKMVIDSLTTILKQTTKAFEIAETSFCFRISSELFETMKKDVVKKKKLFLNDDVAFCSFLTANVANFSSKNQWMQPLIPNIAKCLLSIITRKLSIDEFVIEHPELPDLDQKFLTGREQMLAHFEEEGYDEKVAFLLKDSDVLIPAASTVLQACVVENPIESSCLIVSALKTVEDLFTFQFGEPPEANQLMPLLANLFLRSSIPNPISFGMWIQHFMQTLLSQHSDWFKSDSLNSIEHYFQFNMWMQDFLPQ